MMGQVEDLCRAAIDRSPAVILVDAAAPQAAAAIAAIRDLPAPAKGTPIITVGKASDLMAAVAGHLDLPLKPEMVCEVLTQWAGPLGDHALRAVPFSPRYRLIRLIGFEAAEGMLRRFEVELEAAIADTNVEPQSVRSHRLAGVAGLFGFEELGVLWAASERGGLEEFARAVEASREVLGSVRKASLQ